MLVSELEKTREKDDQKAHTIDTTENLYESPSRVFTAVVTSVGRDIGALTWRKSGSRNLDGPACTQRGQCEQQREPPL